MSEYCGKCDFYDHIAMSAKGNESFYEAFLRENVTLYWSSALKLVREPEPHLEKDESKKIEIHKPSDLVPLYPHLVSMSSRVKDGKGGSAQVVFLMDENWVDHEERKYGDAFGVRKYYRERLADELERVKKEEDTDYV